MFRYITHVHSNDEECTCDQGPEFYNWVVSKGKPVEQAAKEVWEAVLAYNAAVDRAREWE